MVNKFTNAFVIATVITSCGQNVGTDSKSTLRKISIDAKSQLEKNRMSELLSSDSLEETQQVERKYEILSKVLNHQMQGEQTWKEMRDPYRGANLTASYHPDALHEVNRVMAKYGSLYVKETRNAKGEIEAEMVKVDRPWSGFWYPFHNNALYEGEVSPLVKFDRLMAKRGRESNAASKEKERHQGFVTSKWEGLCDAWSLAAVTTPEPTKPKTIMGITFSVPDQKALATFSHLKYDHIKYGIHYQGTAQTDGTFDDIYPEAFHQLAQSVIGKEKSPLVVDIVPGVEVWNKPLFQYRWKITKDEKTKKDVGVDAFLVDAWAWYVNHRQEEVEVPTSTKDVLAFNYKYRLYVDTKDQKAGAFRVVAGQWIEESIEDHPDTVIVPMKSGNLGSHNAEFNKNIDQYKLLFVD